VDPDRNLDGRRRILRATPGTQETWFATGAREAFWEGRFRVENLGPEGDRSRASCRPPERQL
jgi:hypothetical protein